MALVIASRCIHKRRNDAVNSTYEWNVFFLLTHYAKRMHTHTHTHTGGKKESERMRQCRTTNYSYNFYYFVLFLRLELVDASPIQIHFICVHWPIHRFIKPWTLESTTVVWLPIFLRSCFPIFFFCPLLLVTLLCGRDLYMSCPYFAFELNNKCSHRMDGKPCCWLKY